MVLDPTRGCEGDEGYRVTVLGPVQPSEGTCGEDGTEGPVRGQGVGSVVPPSLGTQGKVAASPPACSTALLCFRAWQGPVSTESDVLCHCLVMRGKNGRSAKQSFLSSCSKHL